MRQPKPRPPAIWTMIPERRLDEIADCARKILELIPRRKGVAVVKKRRVIRKRKI